MYYFINVLEGFFNLHTKMWKTLISGFKLFPIAKNFIYIPKFVIFILKKRVKPRASIHNYLKLFTTNHILVKKVKKSLSHSFKSSTKTNKSNTIYIYIRRSEIFSSFQWCFQKWQFFYIYIHNLCLNEPTSIFQENIFGLTRYKNDFREIFFVVLIDIFYGLPLLILFYFGRPMWGAVGPDLLLFKK